MISSKFSPPSSSTEIVDNKLLGSPPVAEFVFTLLSSSPRATWQSDEECPPPEGRGGTLSGIGIVTAEAIVGEEVSVGKVPSDSFDAAPPVTAPSGLT